MDSGNYLASGTLRDGSPITIRGIRPDDREAFREGFEHLSEQTIYHRFFQAKRRLSESELEYLTEVDARNHVGLVAVISNRAGELIIGVGRFVRQGAGRPGLRGADRGGRTPERAEVAFLVQDLFQGRGVGSILLAHLASIARGLGIRVLDAEVLPDNRPMLEVFEHSGLPLTETLRDGVIHVEMRLDEHSPEPAPAAAGSDDERR